MRLDHHGQVQHHRHAREERRAGSKNRNLSSISQFTWADSRTSSATADLLCHNTAFKLRDGVGKLRAARWGAAGDAADLLPRCGSAAAHIAVPMQERMNEGRENKKENK